MRKIRALILVLFLLSASHGFAEPQLLDRVVAVINDEIITLSELDMLLRPIYEHYSQEYEGQRLVNKITEARKKLLNQLIEDRLVFQEAKKLEIEVTEAEIDEELARLKEEFPSEMELEQALNQQGMSFATVRERIQRQIMVRRLHDMEIRSKVVVSPLEMKSYYDSHPSEFINKESVKIRSLTLKKSDDTRRQGLKDEEAWQAIQNLRRQILQGEEFADLAKVHSQDTRAESGGLSEWVEKGNMIPAIDDVIFKLQVGQLSEIVETSMGYHLFRVEERKVGEEKSYEDARDDIYDKIFHEKSKKRFEHWLTNLKRSAYISVR